MQKIHQLISLYLFFVILSICISIGKSIIPTLKNMDPEMKTVERNEP